MRTSLLFLVILLGMGCRGPLEMTLVGDEDMNNGGNTALVRIYELGSDGRFDGAQIGEFWRDDKAVLADDLIRMREVRLYPGASEPLEFPRDKNVRFIGIAADLNQPRGEQWRRVVPVEQLKGNRVRIRIGGDQVYLDSL